MKEWQYYWARFSPEQLFQGEPIINGLSAFGCIQKLGAEGWELVSVTPIIESTGASTDVTYSSPMKSTEKVYVSTLVYFFKRPIEG